MELIALYGSGSEDEAASPRQKAELQSDLLLVIIRALSVTVKHTLQDARPLAALPQLLLLRATCLELKAVVDGMDEFALLGMAARAMGRSATADLRVQLGMPFWLCFCNGLAHRGRGVLDCRKRGRSYGAHHTCGTQAEPRGRAYINGDCSSPL